MADLNSDGNVYTSGQTMYNAPDGTSFDNPAALNMYMRGRLGMNRFMGGGGPASGGGGGAPSGGGSPLGGAYANAMGSARDANESRYSDILSQYQAMTGGGGKPSKKSGNSTASRPGTGGKYGAYRNSGSTLGYFKWLEAMRKGEQTALQRGGQFGAMDASQLYPREWGGGDFLGSPQNAGNSGGAYGQRPSTPPPVYPTYTAPARGNQNY